MHLRRPTGSARSVVVALALGGLVAGTAACSTPGASSGSASSTTATGTITAPVTPEQVAALGDVTLEVWADQGEKDLLDDVVPEFERTFSNVTVNVQLKSFNDLTATVLTAMSSAQAPDVAQGNMGWATDGALVKAGLLRPLDDVAEAYGYTDAAGTAISQLQWSDDGRTFGSGTIYGMSPDNQMVGIFYNKQKLKDLGVSAPKTFEELETALQKAKNAGETPITLGNADKATAMQAFSVVQGAMASPVETVTWIQGADGSTFETEQNRRALDTWARWVKDGYFTKGYDAVSPDDAAAAFAKGEGVFLLAGNWQAGTVSDGDTFGFMAAPPVNGVSASSGSFGLDWHVSATSKASLAAIAFVGTINDPKNSSRLLAVNRVPISTEGLTSDDPMVADLMKASADQLGSGGSLYWYDWATNTMFDTFTAKLQELMAGRTSSTEMLEAVQADVARFQSRP